MQPGGRLPRGEMAIQTQALSGAWAVGGVKHGGREFEFQSLGSNPDILTNCVTSGQLLNICASVFLPDKVGMMAGENASKSSRLPGCLL